MVRYQRVQSMDKVAVCWDSAVAQNFFSYVNTELYHHERFGSRLAAIGYIQGW
ncbi:hypothetical protein M8J71_17650 [Pseudarthrobacter sp. R1]|uniref:hypothetical protein n=1 Tax=Pseudarthrobacter sp. R1 TaxID=2944934 RepID=UPI00210A57A1|nr:hypothetical protein [Pseudarthrobacter sp. R1]MCQ6272293.1 hypothetical protein [Pseudarthrobacter sp. R1]